PPPRDAPSEVNSAELELLAENSGFSEAHARVPWRLLLQSRSCWFLWLQYLILSYPWYFFITWMPTFLAERFPQLSVGCARAWRFCPCFAVALGRSAQGWFP